MIIKWYIIIYEQYFLTGRRATFLMRDFQYVWYLYCLTIIFLQHTEGKFEDIICWILSFSLVVVYVTRMLLIGSLLRMWLTRTPISLILLLRRRISPELKLPSNLVLKSWFIYLLLTLVFYLLYCLDIHTCYKRSWICNVVTVPPSTLSSFRPPITSYYSPTQLSMTKCMCIQTIYPQFVSII